MANTSVPPSWVISSSHLPEGFLRNRTSCAPSGCFRPAFAPALGQSPEVAEESTSSKGSILKVFKIALEEYSKKCTSGPKIFKKIIVGVASHRADFMGAAMV